MRASFRAAGDGESFDAEGVRDEGNIGYGLQHAAAAMSVGAAVQSAYIEVGARVITYDRHHGSAGADAGGVALGFRTYVPPGTRVTGVTVAGRIATVKLCRLDTGGGVRALTTEA